MTARPELWHGLTVETLLPSAAESGGIREVSRDSVNEVVYDLSIYGDAFTAPVGYTVYRSERVRGLYP